MIDAAIDAIDEVGSMLKLKYSHKPRQREIYITSNVMEARAKAAGVHREIKG